MRWPWSRRESDAEVAAPAPPTAPAVERPHADWAALPPLQRTFAAPPLTSAPTAFPTGLASWRTASVMGVVSRQVATDMPVRGALASPPSGSRPAATQPLAMPIVPRLDEPLPQVQRAREGYAAGPSPTAAYPSRPLVSASSAGMPLVQLQAQPLPDGPAPLAPAPPEPSAATELGDQAPTLAEDGQPAPDRPADTPQGLAPSPVAPGPAIQRSAAADRPDGAVGPAVLPAEASTLASLPMPVAGPSRAPDEAGQQAQASVQRLIAGGEQTRGHGETDAAAGQPSGSLADSVSAQAGHDGEPRVVDSPASPHVLTDDAPADPPSEPTDLVAPEGPAPLSAPELPVVARSVDSPIPGADLPVLQRDSQHDALRSSSDSGPAAGASSTPAGLPSGTPAGLAPDPPALPTAGAPPVRVGLGAPLPSSPSMPLVQRSATPEAVTPADHATPGPVEPPVGWPGGGGDLGHDLREPSDSVAPQPVQTPAALGMPVVQRAAAADPDAGGQQIAEDDPTRSSGGSDTWAGGPDPAVATDPGGPSAPTGPSADDLAGLPVVAALPTVATTPLPQLTLAPVSSVDRSTASVQRQAEGGGSGWSSPWPGSAVIGATLPVRPTSTRPGGWAARDDEGARPVVAAPVQRLAVLDAALPLLHAPSTAAADVESDRAAATARRAALELPLGVPPTQPQPVQRHADLAPEDSSGEPEHPEIGRAAAPLQDGIPAVQRAVAAEPDAGSAAPHDPGPGGSSGSQVDELASRLYEPLMSRLRADLLLERERHGLRTDPW